jgi:S1-C subfamily serine protease
MSIPNLNEAATPSQQARSSELTAGQPDAERADQNELDAFVQEYFEGIAEPALKKSSPQLETNEGLSALQADAANAREQVEAIQIADADQVQAEQVGTEQIGTEQIVEAADSSSPAKQPTAVLDETAARSRDSYPLHLVTSTLVSLLLVIALLLATRLVVPSLVENIRYGWYRGQLRAEYELSGHQLKNVSLDSLASVSQLVSQRVGPSVVHINLLRDQADLEGLEQTLFGLPSDHPNMRFEGQGSGFVIDLEGHILTNHHVVEQQGRIEVILSDGRQLPATVVGVDPMTDLAVLKINASGLMAVDWGESDRVVVGTPVWAVGSPFGLQQTVTFGIISGKHRIDFRGTRYEASVPGASAYGDLMQSDVALNPGNSGGPLVNSMGEVVGVNAAILGETYRGISFSIPSRVAERVARNLIENGEVPRGWLGIVMEDISLDSRYDEQGVARPGVRVGGFPQKEPSPARQAGLLVGDIIIEFDHELVMSQNELMKRIGETTIGNPVSVAILRGEQRLELEVVIGKRSIGLK